MTTVLPVATISRMGFDGKSRDYVVRSVELDANENMYGEPLHEIHVVDSWGQAHWWFETTDSLKMRFDAVCTYIPQDDIEANVRVALGNG